MYTGGTQFNFLQRLHQLATSYDDLSEFFSESEGYSVTLHTSNMWDKEFIKKKTILHLVLVDLITSNFRADTTLYTADNSTLTADATMV